MTSSELLSTWDYLADELAPGVPIIANLNTWNNAEQSLRNRVGATSPNLYSWLQSNGYASSVTPVTYSLPAGALPSGSAIGLSGGDEIWFTTDATDPRSSGGAIGQTALRYSSDIQLPDGTVQMLARVKSGNSWSAARPMIYQVGAPTLQITESTVEYVEITNNGVTPIDLEYFRLQGDVRFKFDYNRSPIIAPGQTVIIAEDAAVFTARWATEPDGQFLGRINGDELLRLVDTELNAQYQVSSPLVVDGVPGSFSRPEPEAADPPGLILNEWNAVTASNTAEDADPRLGTVAGNGGDWFELVAVNDTDVRGWRLETSDADSLATIALSQNALWSDIPAGTIITFSQEPVTAQDGTIYNTDVSLDPDTDDWWIHIVTGTANPYTNQTAFPASADNWSLRIANANNITQWGPVGEGLGALLSGVSQSEIGELEANPAPNLDPVTAPYDDGNGSTFGAPNAYGGSFQNFHVLRTGANPGENTNCDATLDLDDALLILEYGVNNRTNFPKLPTQRPEYSNQCRRRRHQPRRFHKHPRRAHHQPMRHRQRQRLLPTCRIVPTRAPRCRRHHRQGPRPTANGRTRPESVGAVRSPTRTWYGCGCGLVGTHPTRTRRRSSCRSSRTCRRSRRRVRTRRRNTTTPTAGNTTRATSGTSRLADSAGPSGGPADRAPRCPIGGQRDSGRSSFPPRSNRRQRPEQQRRRLPPGGWSQGPGWRRCRSASSPARPRVCSNQRSRRWSWRWAEAIESASATGSCGRWARSSDSP